MHDWLSRNKIHRDGAGAPVYAKAQVDAEGRLVLPPELNALYGLQEGVEVHVDLAANTLRLRRPVTQLARVYIEPTNACNLNCRTCIRNNWDEKLGKMSQATFARVLDGLRSLPQPLTVFFGGYGEPLSHRRIVDMVVQAKAIGARVELITNATLLDEDMSRRLIGAGLDMLWVSLDGATPESYSDVRLAEALPQILGNLRRFHELRLDVTPRTELGIAFVAMQSNIGDLPSLLQIGGRLGVRHYSVSGVLAHTEAMCRETLYARTLSEGAARTSAWAPQISLPRMDVNEATRDALYRVLRSGRNVSLGGASLTEAKDRCPFVEKGSAVIAWNGDVSPCLALLHDHTSYLHNRERVSHKYVAGNVNKRKLQDIWLSPDYLAFRRRVQDFEFSPCSFCGGCNLAEENREDCFGNTHPTCGGCLWAQGVIQCP
jgi:MoaA/NifB/PqqE/SkfB family radical SAM enzyme